MSKSTDDNTNIPAEFPLNPVELSLNEIRELLECPDLEIDVRPGWGKRELRSEIRDELERLTFDDLKDLKTPPKPLNYSASISHSPTAGGFALVPRPFAVGFDIEDVGRVTAKAVQRVSTKIEIMASPSPHALWTAKEATFKSLLGSRQSKIMADVIIHEWQIIRQSSELEWKMPEIWKFHATLGKRGGPVVGTGLVFPKAGRIWALFLRPAST